MKNNCYYEPKQKLWQAGYTPNRLNCILKETGFKREKVEIYLFDDDYFLRGSERIYGISLDIGVYIWEILVIAKKC